MPRCCATAAMPAVRQPARPDEDELDRVGGVVLGREDLRVVGFDRESLGGDCSAPSPEKSPMADRLCVPLTIRVEHASECGRLGRIVERLARAEQRVTLTPLSAAAPPGVVAGVAIVEVLSLFRPDEARPPAGARIGSRIETT